MRDAFQIYEFIKHVRFEKASLFSACLVFYTLVHDLLNNSHIFCSSLYTKMIQITGYFFFSLWEIKSQVGADTRRVSITPHCRFFSSPRLVGVSPKASFPLQFVEMCYVGLGWVSAPKLIVRNITPHDGWLRRWLLNVHIFPKKELGKIETELATSWKFIFFIFHFHPLIYFFLPGGKYNFSVVKTERGYTHVYLGLLKPVARSLKIKGNFGISRC
jgi:hypothetical protein